MYSILTTVFLYLSYFVCLQLLLKFIQKKKKNMDETGLSALAC